MALLKDHVLDGIEYKGLYIRFRHLQPEEKVDTTVNTRGILFAYRSKEHANEHEAMPVCYFDVKFAYDLTSPQNMWKQAYAAAKLHPDLIDAVDILE